MASEVDIVNRALQTIGTRTTVTSAEYTNGTSNEAIQAALIIDQLRQDLLRMAPWDCGMNYNNLTYITSSPGTPENSSPATALWQKGQPSPPWLYEYQYPVDCLKACWIVPQLQTGFGGGDVPITTAITGTSPSAWSGPAVRFKVGIDQFYPVTAAAVSAGGSGYAVGDIITLAETVDGDEPIGAPVQLRVLTLTVTAVATVQVITQVLDSAAAQGGSYFATQTNPVAQSSTTGSGTGATFNLTFGSQISQRVILTNQADAILAYVKDIDDPNLMDPLFRDAWINILGARLCHALSGDKTLGKLAIERSNDLILEARKADGNEGLTINDVLPDFIRVRGVNFSSSVSLPGYDWGPVWSNIF